MAFRKMTDTEAAAINRAFERLAANVCPHCGTAIAEQRQVGHCVYAKPCGHRLYQGRVGAFAPKQAESQA